MADPVRPERLSDAEVERALEDVPGWAIRGGKLHREFRFRNFNQAFGFMTRAALYAEVMNHHPEWSNVYATVVVDLVTHSADGITKLDFALAKKMSAISDECAARPR
ncbi:MAG TPA: 4a-hydroxytetrahydrobiopterin dehydratase [Myxococcota bacterium]